MDELYLAYKNRHDVQFFIVYAREPHSRQAFPGTPWNFIRLGQPKTYDERVRYASACRKDWKIDMPILIDDMNNSVAKAYGRLPNSVIIVDADGNVAAKKKWNDPLFIEITLRELVENPPQVQYKSTIGLCEECHAEQVQRIAKEHPITDCGSCHDYFYNRSGASLANKKALKHKKNPEATFDNKNNCNVLCHNLDYLPKKHKVGGLQFSHTDHIDRGAVCINCHGTNGHAFHDVSEKTCLICHVAIGSEEIKPGIKFP